MFLPDAFSSSRIAGIVVWCAILLLTAITDAQEWAQGSEVTPGTAQLVDLSVAAMDSVRGGGSGGTYCQFVILVCGAPPGCHVDQVNSVIWECWDDSGDCTISNPQLYCVVYCDDGITFHFNYADCSD